MRKLLAVSLFATVSFFADAVELKGHLTQGGLVTGQIDGVKSVIFNGQALKTTAQGEFVFGLAVMLN